MKNLISQGNGELYVVFQNIVTAKDPSPDKIYLQGEQLQIKGRFDDYTSNFSAQDLIKISPSPYERNHASLISCYKSEGTTLVNLKKAIRDLQLDDLKGTCQYCGYGSPTSIDHYLPLSDYPEFAVCSINLVPCCIACNGKKKAYWKEGDNRGILNFYVDQIPVVEFLLAEVTFTNKLPVIKYSIKNEEKSVDEFTFSIIEKHFDRLQLIDLYNDETPTYLNELIRNLKIYTTNPTKQFFEKKIMEDAKQLETQFGFNYWQATFRKALAKSEVFLDYLVNLCIVYNNPI